MPRIFWLLSALRKFGTSRSINSKYDDSAGVFCLRVVEHFFPITLRVDRRAGPAVDEDELGPEDEAFAFHVGAHRHDASTAE